MGVRARGSLPWTGSAEWRSSSWCSTTAASHSSAAPAASASPSSSPCPVSSSRACCCARATGQDASSCAASTCDGRDGCCRPSSSSSSSLWPTTAPPPSRRLWRPSCTSPTCPPRARRQRSSTRSTTCGRWRWKSSSTSSGRRFSSWSCAVSRTGYDSPGSWRGSVSLPSSSAQWDTRCSATPGPTGRRSATCCRSSMGAAVAAHVRSGALAGVGCLQVSWGWCFSPSLCWHRSPLPRTG